MSGKRYDFLLTPELTDQIIFGMENQHGDFIMDTREGIIVPIREMEESKEPDRYISLPEWTPADGFHLMEKFVVTLHNPVYRERLREALSLGKGVFRNFKNILKENETIERLWYTFKENWMRARVEEWYEVFSEASILERLGEVPEETETDELVLSDFVLTDDCSRREQRMDDAEREGYAENFPENRTLGCGLYTLRTDGATVGDGNSGTGGEKTGFPAEQNIALSAETPDGEQAGFIRGFTLTGGERVISVCRTLYVEPRFRGLGLADFLIDRFCETSVINGADSLLFELPGISRFLSPRLEERGFVPVSTVYALDAQKWKHRSESP